MRTGRGVIDVAPTPAQLRPYDVAVVIDVLRATSTATQALAAGYQRVLLADSVSAPQPCVPQGALSRASVTV